MVQDDPDMIIDWNGVEGVGQALANEFNAAGIPCLSVNIRIPTCPWFNIVNKEYGLDVGRVFAEEARERGWEGEDVVAILVQVADAGREVNDGIRWMYVTVADELGGMTIVDPDDIGPETTTIGDSGIQVDGKNTLEEAYAQVKNALQNIPADKHLMVYAPNDDMALGALRAIEEAGRDDELLIAGTAAVPEALRQLRENPAWVAEASAFVEFWPEYILAMAVAILEGAEPPDLTKGPQVVLTKDNVDEFYDGDTPKAAPALAPESEYLKDAGVLQRFGHVPGLSE
jgi:ribose transport system substrate-binding protein